MTLSPLLFRRIHKWIGLLLGAQFVLWTLSGTAMALLDQETVGGGPVVKVAASPAFPAAGAWPRVRQKLRGAPVTGLVVRPLLDRLVLEVRTVAGVRLFDAQSGEPVPVDRALATRIAQTSYAGTGPVTQATLLTAPALAVRDHELPIWKVDFADAQHSSFYVSQATGTLLERRNDDWRLWDFFWMLHTMDYSARQSFNHPLIVTVAAGTIWLALTGFYLLFRTAWRSDMRAFARTKRRIWR